MDEPRQSDGMSGGPRAGGQPTGAQVLHACWTLLRADRTLLWLPVLGAASGLLAAGMLFVPGWALGSLLDDRHGNLGAWFGGVAATFAASVVATYFQAALVIGAHQRADGRQPTLGGVLAQAWAYRSPILAWGTLSATVGLAVRAAEERLGILGKIFGFLAGLAWAVASFLAVPVVVAEGLGPIAALKRSAELVRRTWGSSLRTTVRWGITQVLLALPALALVVLGVALLSAGSPTDMAAGALLLAIGILAVAGLAAVFVAISAYARAVIYRFAVGAATPGIDPALMSGVFVPKRFRRRRR